MYKVSVPVMNEPLKRMNRDKILEDIKKLGAKRVFLALAPYYISEEKRKYEIAELRDNCEYFKLHGLEVGAWIWAFMIKEKNEFIHMQSPTGRVSALEICPSDETFRKFASGYLRDIAESGVDLIMYDDDFRYGFLDIGMGCTCKNHLEHMKKALGEIPENLAETLLKGGKNKYRTAWLEANGHFLKLFASEMRETVNSVNPHIRFGVCSCMSLWDTDGTDTETISRLLAGDTKPFMRLIGAPYWAVNKSWNCRLQNIIELERMERSWCGENIEIFSEGDVYPRPRPSCPSSYLEIFDTAMRADGRMNGILKYAIDYTSNAGYENGYIERHLKNEKLYDKIDKYFGNKHACGVRVYERMQKFADMKIPEPVEGTCNVQDIFFSVAARMMSDSSIPTVYDGMGIGGIAFAENVEIVSEEALKRGIITDFRAAEILREKGIDTGIVSVGGKINTVEEYFENTRNYVRLNCTANEISVSDKARISSRLITENGKKIIGSYMYENDCGHKFFVFAFDAYFNGEEIYRSYERSRQLKNAIESFGNGRLPAYSYGNPDFYIMVKKNAEQTAVGLWNIFSDTVINPVIELDGKYEKIEFINCDGRLENSKVYLSEIQPYAFAGFAVKKGEEK